MTATSSNLFIVLRGPSGSGKTTIAKKLFENSKTKTALIQQDHYRFIFNPAGGGSKTNAKVIHQMIEHNTKAALRQGYNVILEGVLGSKNYDEIIDRIIAEHSGSSYIFYFDISFQETLKRHNTKAERSEFGEEEMRVWYPASYKSGHALEKLIPEAFSVDETVQYINDQAEYDCDIVPNTRIT